VTGNYDDIGKFSSDIAMLPRIVTLNDIAIAVAPTGGLSMDAVAKTYRYLDEAELAALNAQKKAKEKPAAAPAKSRRTWRGALMRSIYLAIFAVLLTGCGGDEFPGFARFLLRILVRICEVR